MVLSLKNMCVWSDVLFDLFSLQMNLNVWHEDVIPDKHTKGWPNWHVLTPNVCKMKSIKSVRLLLEICSLSLHWSNIVCISSEGNATNKTNDYMPIRIHIHVCCVFLFPPVCIHRLIHKDAKIKKSQKHVYIYIMRRISRLKTQDFTSTFNRS